jgi:cupin superfamily acireductone dioxygenase involved in methionine salvage
MSKNPAYKTFEEWEEACYLQYTVYMPFVNHLRKEYDYSNDDILQMMNTEPKRYDRLMREYYRYHVAGE